MKAELRAWTLAAAVALPLLAQGGTAGASVGIVKGTISAGEPAAPVAQAVVMLDGPSRTAAPGTPHAVMDQVHDQFVPHVVAVPVGSTVDFPNSDAWLHNVFSTSPARKFDLGMYGQGEVKSVTFENPGVVEVRCNVHPKMKGFIVVHANPYLAVSDEQGTYSIGGVPPGAYELRVWQEDMAEARIPITIGEGQVRALDVRLEKKR